MDRRFFTWLMLTTALFFLWLSFRPQPDPAERGDQPPAAAGQQQPLEPQGKPASEQLGELPDSDDEQTEESDSAGESDANEDSVAEPDATEDEADALQRPHNYPSRAITLGSMDPDKGYRLQVTVTSKGGGVERAELVQQTSPGDFRYRALEFENGYLGYLGVVKAASGVKVRTVPDGSAAALARSPQVDGGLQVGDVIVELGGTAIDSVEAYQDRLRKTKPGNDIDLRVARNGEGQSQTLEFETQLTQAPLDIVRMRPFETERIEGNLSRPSLLTTLASLDSVGIPSGQRSLPALRESLAADWETRELDVPGGEGVEFRLPLAPYLAESPQAANLTLVKRYRLYPVGEKNPDGFTLDFETQVINESQREVSLATRQEGLNGLTLEGWWYSVKISPSFFSGAGQRDVMHAKQIPNHHALATTRQIYSRAKDEPSQPDIILLSEGEPLDVRSLQYIGLDSQYFTGSMLPHPDAPNALDNLRRAGVMAIADVDALKKSQSQGTNTSFWFDTQEQQLAPGEEFSQRYQIFIGPKDSQVLSHHGLGRAIEYGWFPWIAKPLSAILHFFHGIVRNYGLAIILLTLMVRGAMFPLGRKAAMNAQKMQELQPELKRISEKYKDNMEKRAKAMQELYAKHNFKPLAGCLPMFIQLPIFIGLYRSLSVDISLRQEPLIPGMGWCNNLAAPDQLIEWSSWMPEFIAGRGTGWLGPYFNILPMATVALFLLQQKMLMPKATDEQTRMTQNMMKIMTIFMGVLFFKVPSGLCIYFITSSVWSLIERKLVKRFTPASSTPATAATASSETESKPKVGSKGESQGASAQASSSNSTRKKRRGQQPEQTRPTKMQEIMKMLEKPAVRSATQRGSRKPKKRRK